MNYSFILLTDKLMVAWLSCMEANLDSDRH